MRIKKITPVLSLIYERHQFNEIVFVDNTEVSCLGVDSAIDLIFYEMVPIIIAHEDLKGRWIINSGSAIIKAVIMFMEDNHVYSNDGLVEAYRGKRFSELGRNYQRVIRESSLSIFLSDSESELLAGLSKWCGELAK
jgi:hypothetical protein